MRPYLAAVIDQYLGRYKTTHFELLMLLARRAGDYDGVCYRVTPRMLADAMGDERRRRQVADALRELIADGAVIDTGRTGWKVAVDCQKVATHRQTDADEVATHRQDVATDRQEVATHRQPSISSLKVPTKGKSKAEQARLDIAQSALDDFNDIAQRNVTSKRLLANAAQLVKTEGATLDEFRAVNRFKFDQLTALNSERGDPSGKYIDPATFWRKDKWEYHVRQCHAEGLIDDAGNFIEPKRKPTRLTDVAPEDSYVVDHYGARDFANLVERVRDGRTEIDWIEQPGLRKLVEAQIND